MNIHETSIFLYSLYKANLTSIIHNMKVSHYTNQRDRITFSSNKKIILIQLKFTTATISFDKLYSPSLHFYNAHFSKYKDHPQNLSRAVYLHD